MRALTLKGPGRHANKHEMAERNVGLPVRDRLVERWPRPNRPVVANPSGFTSLSMEF